MAPRKRKSEPKQDEPAKTEPTPAAAASGRVTRNSTRLATAKSAELHKQRPSKKKAKKEVEKTEIVNEQVTAEEEKTEIANGEATEVEEKVAELEVTETDGGGDGDVTEKKTKTIVVEYCKQCNSFKTRANQVKDGLEKGVPGITVLLNPEKPRRGCFEIREEGGETFISLLDLKRPFQPMKDLDMDKVISDIVDQVK